MNELRRRLMMAAKAVKGLWDAWFRKEGWMRSEGW